MPERSVTYEKQAEKLKDKTGPLAVPDAVRTLKEVGEVKSAKKYKNAKPRKGFDQTVELVLHLGIDPKQADQMVRGSVSLPKGIGKSKRVIAFCSDDLVEQAKAAGAVEAGADDLVKKIADGWLDFDVAVAHPSLMGKVGKLGRTLGPQGKMPSPKSGTVTPNIVQAVTEYAAGKVEYRNDAGGNVHAAVGKLSFSEDDLRDNIEAFIDHIRRSKPQTAKGQYLKRACISATMSPSITLDVN